MFLADKLQQLVNEFSVFEDPHERLGAIVDRAKKISPLPEVDRNETNRVHGCVSIVWLVGECREGCCYFRSDAASPVVRGLLAVLCDFFSGATAAEIAASDAEPLDALALTRQLTPTRRNGLAAARVAIREFAKKCL